MKDIIRMLREDLKANSDPVIRESSKRFFKEPINCYGIKTAIVQNLGKQYFRAMKNPSKADVFVMCEELWKSGVMEESFVACNWSHGVHKQFDPADIKIFERWIDSYITNWASCDTFCNHTVGDFLQMYPQFIKELKRWAKSENRWMKRAAAVSLIIPARKGMFLPDIFEIANILLTDKDDMVQKGYGWMLKAASQAYEKQVFDYVISKKQIMPRTAYRYAIEKMSADLKREAMQK